MSQQIAIGIISLPDWINWEASRVIIFYSRYRTSEDLFTIVKRKTFTKLMDTILNQEFKSRSLSRYRSNPTNVATSD